MIKLARSPAVRVSWIGVLLLWASGDCLLGQQIEYLPPIAWEEPPRVDPGPVDSAPPSDAIVLFDGRDLSAWRNAKSWRIEDGAAVCGSGRLTTREHFGDCQVHLEWSCPPDVTGSGQDRGNSGIRMMGAFEIQVLDSFGAETYADGQAAAVYKQAPPMVNATRRPGEWNSYDIYWQAPRFDGRKLSAPAVVSVVHNGVLVIDRHELQGATGWDRPPRYEGVGPRGPIMLQYHGDPVRYRNIWVRRLDQPKGTERPAGYVDHATGRTWKAEAGSKAKRCEVRVDRDLDYVGAGNPSQSLDLYVPRGHDRSAPLPLVCFIHGGGWETGSKSRAQPAKQLAETGDYAVASIDYRLSGESIWPSPIHDCKAAIRWLHAHADEYGFDADRIGVWGVSAGGHLAAMLGVSGGVDGLEGGLGEHLDESSRVACVVDWFGPTDLLAMNRQGSTIDAESAESVVGRLLGGTPADAITAYQSASPLGYVTPDDAPTLIVHGTRDTLVPFEQSAELHHALTSQGVPAAFVAVQGAGHGGLGERVTTLCRRFLDSQLRTGLFKMRYQTVPGPGWGRPTPTVAATEIE